MQGCNIIEIGRLMCSTDDELKGLGYHIQTRRKEVPNSNVKIIEHLIYKKEEKENVKNRRK